jgi:hypothetical protein
MPHKAKAYHNLFGGPPAVMSLNTIVDNPGYDLGQTMGLDQGTRA